MTTTAFDDEVLGLMLKGYSVVPNKFLEMKIEVYTPEIVETVLTEHPEIVDRWLQRLHAEYVSKKKQCDFDNDPVACFTLSAYEQYDKSFRSWDDGGLFAITLPRGKVIRVSKKPLITVASNGGHFICEKCSVAFSDLDEFEKHRKQEKEVEKVVEVTAKKKAASSSSSSYDNVAPNPIWWLAP